MNNKPHLVIIARASSDNDLGFYKSLLRQHSPLFGKAILHVFSAVEQFADFIESMPPDFEFALLVHYGLKNPMGRGDDGKEIVHQLSKLPYYSMLKYALTSREGVNDVDGKKVVWTTDLPDDVDVTKFEYNMISELISTKQTGGIAKVSKEKFDFAILTALFEDEHNAFDNQMKSTAVVDEINLKKGTFLEAKNFPEDYQKPILTVWQRNMGMVDAAAFSSRIIAQYQPRFLILGGVCGGRKGKVKLYDVIVPTQIHDYMSGKFKEGKFIPRPLPADPDPELIEFLKTRTSIIKESMRKLASGNLATIMDSGFDIHFSNYACGPWVVKTDGVLLKIAEETNDDIIGLEMESLGAVRAGNLFSEYDKYTIVVKSVMDFTDINKTDGEKGMIKTTAAGMSALCVRAMLPLLETFESVKMKKLKSSLSVK